MKHVKTFEDLSETPEFKIGDYVRLKNSSNYIYQITDYNELLNKWYLEDPLEIDGYRRSDVYWVPDHRLILVPQHEMDAIKYNL